MKKFAIVFLVSTILVTTSCSMVNELDSKALLIGSWDMQVESLDVIVEFTDTDMRIAMLGLDVPYNWIDTDSISYSVQGQEIVSVIELVTPNQMIQSNYQGKFTLERRGIE